MGTLLNDSVSCADLSTQVGSVASIAFDLRWGLDWGERCLRFQTKSMQQHICQLVSELAELQNTTLLASSSHRSSVQHWENSILRGPLREKRLKPPVGERPPKPLEWAEGEEAQPQHASGNVDGPHAHYNVDLLVVLNAPYTFHGPHLNRNWQTTLVKR